MRTLLAFLLFSLVGFSQQTSTTPDNTQVQTFTSACTATGGATLPVPDPTPYVYFRLTFKTDGVSATAASVGVQGAPNNGGVPGTWTTTGLTLVDGAANPIASAAQGTLVLKGYFPFIRILCNSVTGSLGTVTATLLSYKGTNPAAAASGGVATNVNVQNIAGQPTASDGNGGQVPGGTSTALGDGVSNTQTVFEADNAGTPTIGANRTFLMNFNGTNWDRNFVCTNQAEVALSGTGYTQIIAISGSTVIRLCKVFVTSSTGGNPVTNTFTLAYGTGSNCAGGTVELMNAAGITGLDEDFQGALRSAAANAFCVKEATANSDKVTVTYAQY